MKPAQVCRILHYKPRECLQQVVNNGRAQIKQYGCAVPSSCLLCFNSIPNRLDGLFESAALMCYWFRRGLLARWCWETEDARMSHAVLILICVVLMIINVWALFQRAPRCASPTALELVGPASLPVECISTLWFILITRSTPCAPSFLTPTQNRISLYSSGIILLTNAGVFL